MAGSSSLIRLATATVIFGVAVAVYFLRPAADTQPMNSADQSTDQVTVLPRLLDLGSDKCVPCKLMAPILEELKVDYSGILIIDFVDVWKNPSAAQPYGIQVIPTQIFLSADGAELFRHEGFYSRDEILTKWRELGVDLPEKGA